MRKLCSAAFLFFFILSNFSSYSQNRNKSKETSSFTINTSNSTIKFEVLSEKIVFQPIKALTYYWFSTNKILETKGGYDGKLLHGQYACFYMNSNLKEKGKFKKGLKDGEWVSWFENGRIMETITWKSGLKSGPYRSFNEQGHPVLEAEYKNGLLNGKMVTYVNGKMTDTRMYKDDKELDPAIKPKSIKERIYLIFKKDPKKMKEKKSPKPEKKKSFHKEKKKEKTTDDQTISGTKP